jgi:hypothetical protein
VWSVQEKKTVHLTPGLGTTACKKLDAETKERERAS